MAQFELGTSGIMQADVHWQVMMLQCLTTGVQPSGGSGGPIRKQRSHGGVQRCVNAGFPGQACTQCHAQSTPVWRAGPMGPKTLCNACGVRWMKHSKRK